MKLVIYWRKKNINEPGLYHMLARDMYSRELASMFVLLIENDLLKSNFPELVANHSSKESFVKYLIKLKNQNIVFEVDLTSFAKHSCMTSFYNGLVFLQSVNLLNQDNVEFIAAYKSPEIISKLLHSLNVKGILTSENLQAIRAYKSPENMTQALIGLHECNLLNTINRQFIARFDDAVEAVEAVKVSQILNKKNLLSEQNRQHLIENKQHLNLSCRILSDIYTAGILTDSNFLLIQQHQNKVKLGNILNILRNANILNQDSFDALFEISESLKSIRYSAPHKLN